MFWQPVKKSLLSLLLLLSTFAQANENPYHDISEELKGVEVTDLGTEYGLVPVTDHVSKCIAKQIHPEASLPSQIKFDQQSYEFIIRDTGRVLIKASGAIEQNFKPEQMQSTKILIHSVIIAVTHTPQNEISILADAIGETPDVGELLGQTKTPQTQTATLELPQINLTVECRLMK